MQDGKVVDVKSTTAIVPADDSFVLMDREDEQHVLAELSGRNLDKFVFNTPDGPRLTYTGINWACREYAKRGECFRPLGKPEIIVDPRDPEYLIATVVVGRYAVKEDGTERLLDSEIGAKRKWTKQELKSGQVVLDPFHVEKAISMAYRNGKRKLMDSEFVNDLIAKAMKIQGERKEGREAKSKEKPPAKAPAAPAAKPAEQKVATAAASTAAPPELSPDQKALVEAFVSVEPDEKNHKIVWKNLTGLATTKEANSDLLKMVTQLMRGCSAKPPINRLEVSASGGYQIVRIGDGSVLLPVPPLKNGEPF
jgi:hypothetical protein